MRRIVIYIALLVSLLLPFLTACGQNEDAEIKAESVEAFKTLIDISIANLDDDLERLDKELFQNKERQLKLQYVVAPAIEWAEDEQAAMEAKLAGSWVRSLDPAFAAKNFSTDFYQVASVTVRGMDMGGQREEITSEIIVKDLTNGARGEWESMLADLKTQETTFDQRRQTFTEQSRQVVSTFDNVIQNYEKWEVTRINETTFQISGPGLGIPSEGRWVFYRDKGEIVAADEPAKSLEKVLKVQ